MKHVIIGASAAGITAAKTIREIDVKAEIVMISIDAWVHSRCMLHKYLSYERGEMGISFVSEDFFDQYKIQWKKETKVTRIDAVGQKAELEDESNVTYDRLLIATGAASVIPPVGEFRTAGNVFGLRNLSDAQQIRSMAEKAQRILIVGSGLVGMDAAYAFLENGKKVTVAEMADRILPLQLDEKAGKAYQRLFERAGCRFMLGKKATGTVSDASGNISKVILDDNTEIECDLVIVAAGVRPEVSCTEGSGIKADRFIEVDETMQTNYPYVYAAGDVTGISGIWPNAMKQGQAAAQNMCDIPTVYDDRYAMKNTMNFYGLLTLSLGRGVIEEGDKVLISEDSKNYRRAILRNGKLDSILLQGTIDYSGIYQYLIKNEIDLEGKQEGIFNLSFKDFYGVKENGEYQFQIENAAFT